MKGAFSSPISIAETFIYLRRHLTQWSSIAIFAIFLPDTNLLTLIYVSLGAKHLSGFDGKFPIFSVEIRNRNQRGGKIWRQKRKTGEVGIWETSSPSNRHHSRLFSFVWKVLWVETLARWLFNNLFSSSLAVRCSLFNLMDLYRIRTVLSMCFSCFAYLTRPV